MEEVMDFMERYSENAEKGCLERWKLLPVKLYDSEIYEVIGGLLSRQVALSTNLAYSPNTWNGHIAPLVLRSMIDLVITLAWILKIPEERAPKYIMYGLGQEKLLLEHYKAKQEKSPNEQVEKMIQAKTEWLQTQRQEWSIEVNVGNWTEGPTVRDMAIECNLEDLYKLAYTPFSSVTHNTWQHISAYNLKTCTNPLHKFHKIPEIAQVPLDPDYVYRSAIYLDQAFDLVEKKYNLKAKTIAPLEFLETGFEEIFKDKPQE